MKGATAKTQCSIAWLCAEELSQFIARTRPRGSWIDRVNAQDIEAEFERVFCENHARIYRAACLLSDNPTEAKDLTQVTFIRAWRGWAQFEGRSHPYTWLYRILLRTCRRQQRTSWWLACTHWGYGAETEEKLKRIADMQPLPDAVAQRTDDCSEVRAVIRAMSPKLREVLLMRYVEDWPLAQIAEVLGVPEGTVNSRLNLAQKIVAERLRKRGWNE